MSVLSDKTLRLLFIANFCVFCSFTAFFPVLPIILQMKNKAHLQIGMVMSAFPIGVLIFRPVVNRFIQRFSRKRMLLVGTGLLMLSTISYWLPQQIVVLFIVRLLHGFGVATFTTVSVILISDVTSSANRGSTMGFMGMANFLGFGLGPFIADLLYRTNSFTAVLIFSVGCALFAFISILSIADNPVIDRGAPELISVRKTIMRRWILLPAIFMFLAALVQGAILIFLPLFYREDGDFSAGHFFLIFSISALLIRFMTSRAADRYGRGLLILSSAIVLFAALSILSIVKTLVLFILAAALYGAGYGTFQPVLTALVADHTNYHNRGAIFTFYLATFDMGMLISGYFFGAIADLWTVKLIYPICAVVYAVGTVLFLLQIRPTIYASWKWIFFAADRGRICPVCNNELGVDRCDVCKS